jgi:hypothetical protein
VGRALRKMRQYNTYHLEEVVEEAKAWSAGDDSSDFRSPTRMEAVWKVYRATEDRRGRDETARTCRKR